MLFVECFDFLSGFTEITDHITSFMTTLRLALRFVLQLIASTFLLAAFQFSSSLIELYLAFVSYLKRQNFEKRPLK